MVEGIAAEMEIKLMTICKTPTVVIVVPMVVQLVLSLEAVVTLAVEALDSVADMGVDPVEAALKTALAAVVAVALKTALAAVEVAVSDKALADYVGKQLLYLKLLYFL